VKEPTPAEPALFVRSLPLPKHFTASTAAPKTTLQAVAVKLDRFCLIDYTTLSNSFRAARVMLKIRWSDRREQAWAMDDLGCSNLAEAESYVATLALHDIIAIEGKGDRSVWRSFPTAYRDLWDELEEKRKGSLDKERRAVWATLRAIVEARYPPDSPAEAPLVPGAAVKADSKLIPGFDFLPPPPKDLDADAVDPVSLQLQQEFARRQATPAYQRMLVRHTRLCRPTGCIL
jgi:ATP-dependent RNA helicase DHX29